MKRSQNFDFFFHYHDSVKRIYFFLSALGNESEMDRSYGFTLAIKYFGSLKQLRLRAGIKHGKVVYMRNHANKINLMDALKIEIASNGAIRWYYFIDKIDEKIKRRIEEGASSPTKLSIPEKKLSQRVFEAIEYENQLGSRQGKRNDLQLRLHSNEVQGRTAKNIANKFQIDSEWSYRQAKKVLLMGCYELIQEMDNGMAVSLAAKIARYPHKKQRLLLTMHYSEIIFYIKEHFIYE